MAEGTRVVAWRVWGFVSRVVDQAPRVYFATLCYPVVGFGVVGM